MNGIGEDRPAIPNEELSDGLWVGWIYDKKSYLGFIVESDANWANVYCVQFDGHFMPELGEIYCVPKNLLYIKDCPFKNTDDIPDLIYLAKLTKDYEWENELNKELGLWKNASDVFDN